MNGAAGPVRLADLAHGDVAWLHALNEAHAQELGSVRREAFEVLLAMAARTRVAWAGEEPLGALVVLREGTAYASANYLWLSARRARFAYIDRVVVAPHARGRGVGAALYADLMTWAQASGVARVLCEVNERPPNPVSMAFHVRQGFEPIGRLEHPGGKRVVYLERRLDGLTRAGA